MRENEADFSRVQLGIHRHGDVAPMPAGEQALDEGGAVAHDQRHPVPRLQPERRAEAASDRCGTSHQFAVIGDAVGSNDDRGALGAGPSGPEQEVRDVHPRRPPVIARCGERRLLTEVAIAALMSSVVNV
jgi:hypothetical protein